MADEVIPDNFFTEPEKVMLAQLTATFGADVHDQESFDDYLYTMRLALDHDEATKLLAMAAAVIASVSNEAVREAAHLILVLKATEN